jgi:hypothetical protein
MAPAMIRRHYRASVPLKPRHRILKHLAVVERGGVFALAGCEGRAANTANYPACVREWIDPNRSSVTH